MLRELLNEQIVAHTLPGWEAFLEEEMKQPYFEKLDAFVAAAYAEMTCYPPREDIFNAFRIAPQSVRVVLLGQDPYHELGQAMGIAFSVREGIKAPPSLKNILKEAASDVGANATDTDLTRWVKQGVFLCNTTLTVEQGKANAHAKAGWSIFVEHAVRYLLSVAGRQNVAAILWGSYAQKFSGLFCPENVISSAHPSPLSAYRGFFGSQPFSKANAILAGAGQNRIEW